MRRILFLAPLLLALGVAQAREPITKPAKGTDKTTCSGDFGTSVQFEKTPSDAAKKAVKEEKLVLVLHISGHFEDPNLT